jgi:hypothetical protein
MVKKKVTTTAAAMLVAAAIAAPSASANPGFVPDDGEGTANKGGTPTVVTRTVETHSSGFDWGDAGLGAAGVLSLLGLGAGAVVVSRRSRNSQPAIG